MLRLGGAVFDLIQEGRVGRSPTTEQSDRFMESLACLREAVFGFGRHNGIYLPFNEPAAFELAKHLNQHLLRDVGDLTLHFVESPNAT